MVGSLVSLKAEIKKRFPAAKLSGGGTEIENYDFEEQSASGKHVYMLNINSENGSSIFISLMKLY